MDGVDASIIRSDGNREYSIKLNKYLNMAKTPAKTNKFKSQDINCR